MIKFFSAVIAGAMVAMVTVPTLADSAPGISAGTIYNSEGQVINATEHDDVWGDTNFDFLGNITVDGVVPGICMYIPLGASMDALIKEDASNVTDAEIVAALDPDEFKAVTTLTADKHYLKKDLNGFTYATNYATGSAVAKFLKKTPVTEVKVGDYAPIVNLSGNAIGYTNISEDGKIPNMTYTETEGDTTFTFIGTEEEVKNASNTAKAQYGKVISQDAYHDGDAYYETSLNSLQIKSAVADAIIKNCYSISLDSLTNEDYFKFDVDKEDGGKYIKNISVVSDKKLGSINSSTAYLKVELNDLATASELKSAGTISFQAKDDSISYSSGSNKLTSSDVWTSGDTIQFTYTFWINNRKIKNDENADSGDRIYFDPDDNQDNTLIWGDDRAGLYFESDDDAAKFYARLSTKTDSEIYAQYGEPINADLWFFDFGTATIPATARATLTIGIPWNEDNDNAPNPKNCYIYQKNAAGTLTDVTSQFTYDVNNDGTTDIEGWSIKTHTLATYIVSDTVLDTASISENKVVPDGTSTTSVAGVLVGNDEKLIPTTGTPIKMNITVIIAVVSLVAAGAIAFKKC